jgi:hypothetical protein
MFQFICLESRKTNNKLVFEETNEQKKENLYQAFMEKEEVRTLQNE